MIVLFLAIALLAAFTSVVVGRRLTASINAAVFSLVALAAAFAADHTGAIGWLPLTLALAVLAVIQLIGWMLVDIDRDHLPATDAPTRLARGLAFVLLGAGLALLGLALVRVSVPIAAPRPEALDAARIGMAFFGDATELVVLCGLVVSAALLATMTSLRDDGEVR